MSKAFLAISVVLLSSAGVSAQRPLPLKLAPRATTAAITEQDLMTRLYIFADDSMQGRQAGRVGNQKGNDYIARELRRLGVEPGGDNGTYFQELPSALRKFTDRSTLSVDGRALRWNTDFVATAGNAAPRPVMNAQVIYGGTVGDSTGLIAAEAAAGKFVVLSPAPAGQGRGGGGGGRGRGGRGGGNPSLSPQVRYSGAAAIAVVDLDNLTMPSRVALNNPQLAAIDVDNQGNVVRATSGPASIRLTNEAASTLFSRPLQGLTPGATGGAVSARLEFVEQKTPQYTRNVIGIIRGSDPVLKGQFVAVGAHNDHVGFRGAGPIDHDSARAVATAALARSFVGDSLIRPLPPEERAAIRVNLDSIRRLRPARMDSINNGADDDGSGSMAMLEIAEAMARSPAKPRRSVIFVWHTAEERGLLGAAYFTANPTVPRDSIVAQINMDMIGRGRSNDIPGGNDDYVGVVGSKMLSNDLGDAVVAVNQRQQRPLKLDYRFDQNVTETLGGAYNNIYGRSDHARYARYNIPIAFFFTGLHMDYHQVTDEPQYIDYPHYNRIANYLRDLVVEIANQDKRPALIKPVS
ncbi:MAG: M20/M25/M40 family metallo-hydrolase [Gemmatimonadota bacterium]